MTKSTITRERAQQIFLGNGPEPSASEERELARMALAAMDSEPVAEVVSIYGDTEAFGEREIRPLVGIQQMPYWTKLYRHAQPVPVVNYVPLGDSPYDVPYSMPSNLREFIDQEIGILFSDDDAQGVWIACRRAAMLAAAPQPQNAPQNIPEIIPDGWIPVSEHLPKEKGVYQVWNGKYVDNVPFWFGSFQSLHSELITHWMPLPAAPQEVKP